MSTIYIIQGSDAPLHSSNIQNILTGLISEKRISEFKSINALDDLAVMRDQASAGDMVISCLTHEMEPRKKEIDSTLHHLKENGVKVAEIVIDNIPYDNDFLTFPINLKPIRSREDMDVVWTEIGTQLREVFPIREDPNPPIPIDYKKYLTYALYVVLALIAVFFIKSRIGSGEGEIKADFEASLTECAAPCVVEFANTSKHAENYSWDFGDQTARSSEHQPSHRFETPGIFVVTLVASRNQETSRKSSRIKITASPSDNGGLNGTSQLGVLVESTNIKITNTNLRGPAKSLGEVEIVAPKAGKVIVVFDGTCVSSPGDRIVLAASNTIGWKSNDGNTSFEAASNNHNGGSFSHTRIYDVSSGSYKYYAIAQNYVETNGNGQASVYGNLIARYIPNSSDIKSTNLNISKTNINLRGQAVSLGGLNIPVANPGKVIVHFNGNCLSNPGDRIVLAASDRIGWAPNDGNTSVIAVNNNVNGSTFSHTRVYDVASGQQSFYAVAQNYVETHGNGMASVYGTLELTYIPNTSDLKVSSSGIIKTNVNLRGTAIEIGRTNFQTNKPGKVIVRFDGTCISSPGDRIVLAASDRVGWLPNDGNTSVEAVSNSVNRNSFSHSRVYEVEPGQHSFYAVAQNYVETSGNGKASVYGTLTTTFFPD